MFNPPGGNDVRHHFSVSDIDPTGNFDQSHQRGSAQLTDNTSSSRDPNLSLQDSHPLPLTTNSSFSLDSTEQHVPEKPFSTGQLDSHPQLEGTRSESEIHTHVVQDSPYPEVQVSVNPTDDRTLPVSTARAWILGLMAAIIIPGINQFFFYRYPGCMVTGIVAQVLIHPLGLAFSALPRGVDERSWWRVFNPGPWNVKEHTLVFIMANVSCGSAYATNLVAVQRFHYNQTWGWGYQILLVLSTQLLGFAYCGYLQRFLVRPATMIWPITLVNTALFNALHSPPSRTSTTKAGRSRQTFFYLNVGAMFIWSFLPNYLFTALSTFDWVTWIKPNHQVVNLLFGYRTGAGLSLLTFDWGMASAFNNPLATPWWTTANIAAGFAFFVWFLAPIMYYSNAFYAKYLPFSSARIFDNAANTYNVTKVLTAAMTFDEDGYSKYSPVYLPITFALCYGLSFAAITATIVHCVLFYSRQGITPVLTLLMTLLSFWDTSKVRNTDKVWHQAQNRNSPASDIHATLMLAYPRVPTMWYFALFLVTLSTSVAAIAAWPTGLPVWALLLAIAAGGVMVLPIGIIQAVTNMQVPLNFVSEMLIGAIVPGKPVAMMIFKTYGYISTTQALTFVSDQKIAHYMKLPPRTVFVAQISATIIGSLVQLGVQEWLFDHVPGICILGTKDWWCPSTQTFFAASVLYGLIGPNRLFGAGQIYHRLLLFFPVGAILPVITYLLARRYPLSFWKYVNWPVIFSCIGLLPPFLPINFISFCFMGFVFQFYVRRKYFIWWSRYNFILSAAWTCGYALCLIFIFFCLQFPESGNIGKSVQNWWGNTVYTHTLDEKGGSKAAALHLGDGEVFGLEAGTWR